MDQGVIKLEGPRNWGVWKFQVKVLLRAQNVLGVVEGTEIQTTANGEDWSKRDAKAQSLLVTRLSESAMLHILTCETAAQMWSKLLSVYEQKSSTSVHLLQQRFFNFKYEEGMEMSVFLSKLQEVKSLLKQAGEEMSDKLIITKVLMSLPDKYSHFVSAWESVDPQKQNYDDLVARLLVEEERMQSKSSEGENVALYVQKQNRDSGGNMKCFKCGRVGHFIQQCKSSTDTRKCFICHKTGHLKYQCPKREKFVVRQDIRGENSNKHNNHKSNAFSAVTASQAMSLDGSNRQQLNSSNSSKWVIDSGASEHMTFDRDLFTSTSFCQTSERSVVVGDGRHLPVLGVGEVQFINNKLSEVLYVPDLRVNLFSVSSATSKGYTVDLSKDKCQIFKSNVLCETGLREENFYVINFIRDAQCALTVSLGEWHQRLCHQSLEHVKSVLRRNNINYSDDSHKCVPCIKGKAHQQPFCESNSCAAQPLELVHADVCGPFEVTSLGGARYFLLIKDDFTRFRTVYFLTQKSEVFDKVKMFITTAENQLNLKLKKFRSDNGTEFINREMATLFNDKGVIHETSVVYTPQQNGRAEREMRTLVEAARTMLHSSNKLSKELWAEAINTAVYVLNRTSKSNTEGETPYQAWTGKCYDISKLNKIFGTKVWTHVPKTKRQKLDSKAREGVFTGYEDSKGYRIYLEIEKTVVIQRDVIFVNEKAEETGINTEGEIILLDLFESDEVEQEPEERVVESEEVEDEVPPDFSEEELVRTRSGRIVRRPRWLDSCDTAFLCVLNEPTTYEEAINCEHSEKWYEAMENEVKVLAENNTWTEVEIPDGKKVIDTKWVYRVKYDGEGNPHQFKARLVARGFQQNDDYELHELYAPVAKISTFRLMLAIANKLRLPVHHMDVKSAFLYGDIKEEVYVKLPLGHKDRDCKVGKLNKSLYGLRKSPKCWNIKFDSVVAEKGFIRSQNDSCLYVKCSSEYKLYLLVFVDDICIFGTNQSEVQDLKLYLSSKFSMKDLGVMTNYLGIEVTQDLTNGVTKLSQSNYLKKVVEKFQMSESKPNSTPMEYKLSLTMSKDCDKNFENKCRQIIGSIMYAALCTRPDLCTSISYLSRFQSYADEPLYRALKRVLRYINATLDLKLIYKADDQTDLCGYVDADWGGDVNDRKSTSGFVFKLFDCVISWSSRKQSTVSLSSTEAELLALSSCITEACWLKNVLHDFQWVSSPVIINVDNQAAINIGINPENNKRVKHLDIKYHFIKEKIDSNVVELKYLKSEHQIADLFTKSLARPRFLYFREKLGLSS